MIARALGKIESVTAPFWQWCAGFFAVLVVRFFLENLSGPAASFPAVPDTITVIHYVLFFVGIFLSLALAVNIFVKDIARVSKFLFFGFPVIWLSPIFDLISSHGGGYLMTYIFAGNAPDLARAFFHIGSVNIWNGLTPGLGTELVVIVLGVLWYTAIKTRNVVKSIASAALSYCVFFFWMVLPGLLAIAASGRGIASPSVAPYLISLFGSSHLLINLLRPTVNFSYLYAAETAFSGGMAIILYLLDLALVILWNLVRDPAATKAFARNLRVERMAFYIGLVIMGLLGAARGGTGMALGNWVDAALFLCLIAAFFCAFLFAIGVNDMADINTDRVTGKGRPLPSGALTESDMKNGNVFFLLWTLLGGILCGYWALFTLGLFTAAYYAYSAPPLRLKRIPFISSFMIALAALAALMSGFYFADANKLVADMPVRVVALILVCITLAVNFKDIKDIEGDRADGVWTIPVIFGEKIGKEVTGILLAAAFIAVPPILGATALFAPSLIAAVAGYLFVTAKKYREWRVFVLYFLYASAAGWILWLNPALIQR